MHYLADIKREIHLWPQNDGFKALLYHQGELRGVMLNFYLQFMLQLENLLFNNVPYIVHNQTTLVLDLMHIDKGIVGEKIAQWGVRNLHSMNGLENALVLPYNRHSHQSIFILEHHLTLHFDSILGYQCTYPKQFVKCVALMWSYIKGISHNSNEWAVIGIRPIIHVPLPKQNGAWGCGYLVVECFSQYLDKCGDREHCPSVEVSPENLLLTYFHNYFKYVPTLYSTFAWFNLWDHNIMCLLISMFQWALWFPFCFKYFNGVDVSSLCFYHGCSHVIRTHTCLFGALLDDCLFQNIFKIS